MSTTARHMQKSHPVKKKRVERGVLSSKRRDKNHGTRKSTIRRSSRAEDSKGSWLKGLEIKPTTGGRATQRQGAGVE